MAKPPKAEVEEANNEPLVIRKLPAMEDEALAAKPPVASMVNKVEEAEFWTIKAEAKAELVAVRKVRMVEEAAVLEVAAIVATEKAG